MNIKNLKDQLELNEFQFESRCKRLKELYANDAPNFMVLAEFELIRTAGSNISDITKKINSLKNAQHNTEE